MSWTKFEALPNYFGGKRRLIKDIFKHIKKKDGVFIDAFLGGAANDALNAGMQKIASGASTPAEVAAEVEKLLRK